MVTCEVWQGTKTKHLNELLENRLYIEGRLFKPFFLDKRVKKTIAYAFDDGKLIGVAGINHARKYNKNFEWRWFGSYIKPDYRGRGIAICLLMLCFKKAGWLDKPSRAKNYIADNNLYDILERKMTSDEARRLFRVFEVDPI